MKQASQIVVRGYHVDFNGHVNNCRFLEYFEEARWEYFSSFLDLGKAHHSRFQIVVVRIAIDFATPAFVGDKLRIGVEVKKIGTKSFTLEQVCKNADTDLEVAKAEVVCVISSIESAKAVILEGEVERLVFDGLLDKEEISKLRV